MLYNNLNYLFEVQGVNLFLLSTSIVPDRSAAFTLTVIIAGLGTVLLTLTLLIILFNLFGKAVSSTQKRALKKHPKEENPVPAPVEVNNIPLPLEADEGAPPEVVAAITAAVYMMEGEGATVKSITRKKSPDNLRSAWAQAAVIDNTRPF